jgi:mRNA interferase MazF
MKKNEIWLADLNPRKGKEQSGNRPVVIISGNAMNDHIELVIACPISSVIKNFVGDIILNPSKENGLKKVSEILVFHVRSIAKERLIKKLGTITDNEMKVLIENLNKILTY